MRMPTTALLRRVAAAVAVIAAAAAAAASVPSAAAFVPPSSPQFAESNYADAAFTFFRHRQRSPGTLKHAAVGAAADCGRARPRRRRRASSPTLSSSVDDGASDGGGGTEEVARGRGGGGTRDMAALQEWAYSRGFQVADGVKLASDDGTEWGITLHQSTPAGTALVRVPKSITLSSADAVDAILSKEELKLARSVVEERDMEEHWTEFLLFARIVVERARGTDSDWSPWLDSLPSTFTTGLFMDEVELSRLPALAALLVSLQRRQLEAFEGALRAVTAENDEVRAALEGSDDGNELVRWAFSVVFSRSHRYKSEETGEPSTEIVPMGDLFNHREPGDVVWNDDGEYSEFVLKEDVTLQEGEDSRDIHLSYGLSNPHRYLAVFGFVDEQTPEVLSQVIFTDPSPEMLEFGCNDPTRMVFRSDGLVANAVWDSLLFAILFDRPEEQKALYDAHVKGDREAKAAVHARHALEVAIALKRHVDQTLEGAYSEENTDVVSAGDPAEHPLLPMVCRLNSLMRTIFTRVKLRLDGIVEREYRRRMAQQQQQKR